MKEELMTSERKTAIAVGTLFLVAMVASLLGGGMVGSAVGDASLPAGVMGSQTQLAAGILLELVNAVAVLLIGVLMLPVLRPHGENLARGYLGFRTVEAVFCSAIVIGPLVLLSSSREVAPSGPAAVAAEAVGILAMAQRLAIAGLLVPVFFCLGAFVLYAALYRTRLLPRTISVWGLVATALVLGMNLAALWVEAPAAVMMALALPIILNEIVMGIWLIARGFNGSAPQALDATWGTVAVQSPRTGGLAR